VGCDKDLDSTDVIAAAPPGDVTVTQSKLQHEFKHAAKFGVAGNPKGPTSQQLGNFAQALCNHLNKADNDRIEGNWFEGRPGGCECTHNYDPHTDLCVGVNRNNEIVYAMQLGPAQVGHLSSTGKLR